jgi:hypothetical protein
VVVELALERFCPRLWAPKLTIPYVRLPGKRIARAQWRSGPGFADRAVALMALAAGVGIR